MKQPTIKYPSGLEVSLAAFLLKLTSPDIGQARRLSILPERSGVPEGGTLSTHSHKKTRQERRTIQE